MGSDDETVKALLTRIGGDADRLTAVFADLEREVARRRRRRWVVGSAASALAVTALVAVVPGMVPDRSAGSGTATAPTSGTGTRAHPISCGAVLAPPVTRAGQRGLALSITAVSRTAGTPVPQVTVSLSATANALTTQPGTTPLQVLLLKDGVVVGRFATYRMLPDAAPKDWIGDVATPGSLSGESAVGTLWRAAPGQPHTVVVTGPAHCAPDWNQAWSGAARYRLLAVMSLPHPMDLPAPPATGGPESLLVSAPVAVQVR